MRRFVLAGAVALVAFACTTAQAGTVVYTSSSDWENQVVSFDTEDFNDPTLNSGITLDSTVGNVDSSAPDKFWDRLTGSGFTVWEFDTALRAWGGTFDLAGPGGPGQSINVFNGNSLVFVGNIPNSTSNTFWGFTSTTGFTKVKLIAGSAPGVAETYTMDNMVYATQVVPLPPAAWLGLGLLGTIGLVGRLRRRRAIDLA